jgi:hypothetical protein
MKFKKWVGGLDEIDVAQDRDTRLALVNSVENSSSIKFGEFRDYLRTY